MLLCDGDLMSSLRLLRRYFSFESFALLLPFLVVCIVTSASGLLLRTNRNIMSLLGHYQYYTVSDFCSFP